MPVRLRNGEIRSLPTFHSYTGRKRDEINKTSELNKNVEVIDGEELPEPTTLVLPSEL
jgi:hypothetical protein